MFRLLALAALAFSPAAGLQLEPQAEAFPPECEHDREAAFRNFQEGRGSLWLFHVTHNAGTSLLQLVKENAELSEFRVDPNVGMRESDLEPGKVYYDWVFGEQGLRSRPFSEQVPCKSDRFVSVFAVRNPLPRILSGDGMWTTNATDYTDRCNTDNYGLRKLVGRRFEEALTPDDVKLAKSRLQAFDIILDVETMYESMGGMCKALGFKSCPRPWVGSNHGATSLEEVKAKVGPAVFNKWMEINAPELEVYQFAQKISREFLGNYRMPPDVPNATRAEAAHEVDDTSDQHWICSMS